MNVGIGWEVVGFVRHTVYLKRTSFVGRDLVVTSDVLDLWEGLRKVAGATVSLPCSDATDDRAPVGTQGNSAIIYSAAAEEHLREHPHHKLKRGPREGASVSLGPSSATTLGYVLKAMRNMSPKF